MCSDGYVQMCSDGCVLMCSDGCVLMCSDRCCSGGAHVTIMSCDVVLKVYKLYHCQQDPVYIRTIIIVQL